MCRVYLAEQEQLVETEFQETMDQLAPQEKLEIEVLQELGVHLVPLAPLVQLEFEDLPETKESMVLMALMATLVVQAEMVSLEHQDLR